jgi:hypothetical protein
MERLRAGDPDLTSDEPDAAISRAKVKRRDLAAEQTAAKHTAEVLSMLPRAANLYREQIEAGLSGDSRGVQKGRAIVRELLDGPVKLMPRDDGSRWAEFALRPSVLLASTSRLGIDGSGGVIPTNSTAVIPFSSADRRRKDTSIKIPEHCGNGHLLTPHNVRIDQRERRWRCRQCGNDRAAAFRDRRRTG